MSDQRKLPGGGPITVFHGVLLPFQYGHELSWTLFGDPEETQRVVMPWTSWVELAEAILKRNRELERLEAP